MLLLRAPNPALVQASLTAGQTAAFTYPQHGGTETGQFPPGYRVDHNRLLLGQGPTAWDRAVRALRAWAMFQLPWCRLYPPSPEVRQGAVVAVAFRHFGFWSLNSARIVYVIDEPDRQAFAYGTLPGHSESGEERFQVERSADGAVHFDLLAFSRPRDPLARLAFPLARHLQRRFVRESMATMKRAVF